MATGVVSVAATRRRWNTFQLLKAMRLAALLLDAVVLLVVLSTAREHRLAVRSIGKDAAPSIIAAQHIKAAMADMDANAANELLQGPSGSSVAVQAYDRRRTEAVEALIAAAENITYGDAERRPIQTLALGLGSYERSVQRARDLADRGEGAKVDAYDQAADVLDATLLPAADALDAANNDELEKTYAAQSFRSAAARALLAVVGLLVLLSLGIAQLFLSRRMHRTFNLPLLGATLLALLLGMHVWGALARSHEQLRVAKEDAFTSIHALWRARALAYAANSDESRYLLDPGHASGWQQAFTSKANQLATLPPGLDGPQLMAAAREGHKLDGFAGYLADELNNITFAGEREAALDTLASWQSYVAIDGQIRSLERSGQHRAAVALCTGVNAGQSNWAFDRFDRALDTTLATNQAAFEAAVNRGFSDLQGLEWQACAGAAALALLVLLGFAPRLKEYR